MRAHIGLGSNLGDRLAHLTSAIERLAHHGVKMVAASSVYETEPVGPPQPDFLNAVCVVETDLDPQQLVAVLKKVEAEVGRTASERWGPREIDLDLLLYEDATVDLPALKVPHPELTARAFVMVPLLELDPDLELPSGEPVAAFCERDPKGVRRTDLSLGDFG